MDGLERLGRVGAVRVPRLLGQGASGNEAWIELEWLDLHRPDAAADEQLGAALARLHAVTGPSFGLDRDNAIGATAQPNAPSDDWTDFWRVRRLGFQLGLAARNGYGGRLQDRGRRLLDELSAFFTNHRPQPSLLHGDLWSGNAGFTAEGPVVFDPAVYYGDRETDLAMTELFGGFPREFYQGYNEAFALAPGYEQRKHLYNLYHLLNHLNIFGGGYLSQVKATLSLLAGRL
jgi:protein-ribulosamine 3-kinase